MCPRGNPRRSRPEPIYDNSLRWIADDDLPASVTAVRGSSHENWRRRLSALVAATGRDEADLLEEALQLLGMKVLGESHTNRNGKSGARKK